MTPLLPSSRSTRSDSGRTMGISLPTARLMPLLAFPPGDTGPCRRQSSVLLTLRPRSSRPFPAKRQNRPFLLLQDLHLKRKVNSWLGARPSPVSFAAFLLVSPLNWKIFLYSLFFNTKFTNKRNSVKRFRAQSNCHLCGWRDT